MCKLRCADVKIGFMAPELDESGGMLRHFLSDEQLYNSKYVLLYLPYYLILVNSQLGAIIKYQRSFFLQITTDKIERKTDKICISDKKSAYVMEIVVNHHYFIFIFYMF